MNDDKPWRVVSPHNIAWVVHFATEEAAWGRLLSSQHMRHDTRANRMAILALGWKVVEVTSAFGR